MTKDLLAMSDWMTECGVTHLDRMGTFYFNKKSRMSPLMFQLVESTQLVAMSQTPF